MIAEFRDIHQKWFSEDVPVNFKRPTAVLGDDANGTITVIHDVYDIDADGYELAVIIPETEEELSATLEDKKITVSLETGDAEKATASLSDGAIDIEVDAAGVAGNAYTVVVQNGTAGAELSANLAGTDLTVLLGMTTPVKASATIGSGEHGVVTIEVDTAGAAGNAYTIEVVNGDVYGAVLTDSALVVTVRAAGDSAESVSNLINSEVGATFTATFSGTGADLLTTPEALKSFEGGLDSAPDDAKNTATLVAAAINTNDGITATVATGEADTIIIAEVEKSFTGGSDFGVNNAGNIASLVAAAISTIDGFTATASGTGETPISVATVEDIAFEDGTWGTPCPVKNSGFYSDSYYYVCTKADGTKYNDGWRRFTLTNY